MLTKVMKYDIKTQFKTLIPIYLILMGMTGLTILSSYLSNAIKPLSFLTGLMIAGVIIIIVITLIMTFFRSVQNFYQDFVTQRGYLVNTIPVKKSVLLTSKILTSMFTMIISVIVILIAIFILLLTLGAMPTISSFVGEVLATKELYVLEFIIFFASSLLLSYFSQLLMCFFAISLGQFRNTGKLIGAVSSWFLLYIGYEILSVVGLGTLFLLAPNLLIETEALIPQPWMLYTLLTTISIVVLIFSVISIYGTNYILSKKLNLE